MRFLRAFAGSIKILFFVPLYHEWKLFAVEFKQSLYPFFSRTVYGSLLLTQHYFSLFCYFRRCQHPDGAQINLLHLDDRMFLIVPDGIVTNHIPVNHILQVKKCCCFMPADVSQVIRTGATQGQGTGIPVFLNMHLVKGVVVIVFYPETNGI